MNMPTWVQIDVEITALITLIFTALYYSVYIIFWKKWYIPRQQLMEQLIKAVPKINEVHAQFYLNGGSSMADRLVRIENSLVHIGQVQHVHLLEHELGIYQTDENGDCISVNRTYCRIVDRTEGECLGTGWVDVIHPADADDVLRVWKNAVKGRRDFRMNYRMVRADGKEVPVFGTAHPMINPYTRQLIGYLGTIKEKNES